MFTLHLILLLITGAHFQTIDGPLGELDCLTKLNELTRQINEFLSLANLPLVRIHLLASAAVDVAMFSVDFVLIEHISYAKNTYPIYFSLDFSMPLACSANVSPTEKWYSKLDLAPFIYAAEQHILPVDWRNAWESNLSGQEHFVVYSPKYESILMARNGIDKLFFDAAQYIFAGRLVNKLRADSLLPRTLTLRLRNMTPLNLLIDPLIEAKICAHVIRFLNLESLKMQINNPWYSLTQFKQFSYILCSWLIALTFLAIVYLLKISEFVLTVDMTCICEFATGVVMFAMAIMYLSIIVGLLASDSNSHDNVMWTGVWVILNCPGNSILGFSWFYGRFLSIMS